MVNDACLTHECERPILNRGLCRFHYRKALKKGNLDEVGHPKRRPAIERYGDQMVKMWDAGMTMAEIAKKLGTSGPTVKAVLERKGIENPGRHTPRSLLKKQRQAQHSVEGLRNLDQLPVDEALLQAWTAPDQEPQLRQAAQDQIREVMPLLARALDRLVRKS